MILEFTACQIKNNLTINQTLKHETKKRSSDWMIEIGLSYLCSNCRRVLEWVAATESDIVRNI